VNTTTFVSPEFSVVCDAYGSFTMYLKSREKDLGGTAGLFDVSS